MPAQIADRTLAGHATFDTGRPGPAWLWATARVEGGPSPWRVWPQHPEATRLGWQEAGKDHLVLGLGEVWRGGPSELPSLLALLDSHPGLVALGGPGWPGDARQEGGWIVPEWVWQGSPEGGVGTWQWQGRALVGDGEPDWQAACNASVDRFLGAGDVATPADGPRWTRPHLVQGKDRFLAGARRVIGEMTGDGLAKVVLSRDVTLRTTGRADPWAVFRGMARRAQDSHRMAWQDAGGPVWVAASPERLCAWQGNRFVTEALAGTAKTRADEPHLGTLDRPAAVSEQAIVQSGVRQALAGVATDLVEGHPVPTAWQGLVHLKATLTGQLAPGRTAADLVAVLNPTAAVAGAPSHEAQAWITFLEGRPRQRYGAPFGCLGAGGGVLAVWLRGACIEGEEARVTVGAGLVRGSTPEGEWAETEAKLSAIVGLLGSDA
ncbi:MAG: chorismate-binding protein [Candidatus Sericytochromatia bacterium]|nr:chorismate-binding protein [Candidatus Tanganyikabacteria bacterium]